MRWTTMSRVSLDWNVTETESRRIEAETVSHGSDQDRGGERRETVSPATPDAEEDGAAMEAEVTATMVAADRTREGRTPMERATRGRASAPLANSRGRRVTAGTEARLRPSRVCPISTCPLWRRTDWF